MKNSFIVIACAIVGLLCVTRQAQANVNEAQACSILKERAIKDHFAAEVPSGYYKCDVEPLSDGFFVIALHYVGGEPAGWVGSTLVDWYAIRAKDGKLYSYDVGNMVVGTPVK